VANIMSRKCPKNCRFGDYHHADNPRQKAMAERFVNERTLASTARYLEIAQEAGMSPVTLATAWSMDFDFVAIYYNRRALGESVR